MVQLCNCQRGFLLSIAIQELERLSIVERLSISIKIEQIIPYVNFANSASDINHFFKINFFSVLYNKIWIIKGYNVQKL